MIESKELLTDKHFEEVLKDVLEQVRVGKGNERHGNSIPFEDQPWRLISDNVGDGFVIGQAIKKLMELKAHNKFIAGAQTELERQSGYAKWKSDAIGAIVYTVMAIMYKETTIS